MAQSTDIDENDCDDNEEALIDDATAPKYLVKL